MPRIAICLVLMAAVLLAPSPRAAADDSASATVTLHASVRSLIAVDFPGAMADCRLLLPSESGGGNRSSYCALTAPLTIRVRSNEPWSATFSLSDCATPQPGMSLQSSALRAGPSPITTFPEAANATILKPGVLLAVHSYPAGIATWAWYPVLRLTNGDDPADFCATLSYAATQDSSASATLGAVELRFRPTS